MSKGAIKQVFSLITLLFVPGLSATTSIAQEERAPKEGSSSLAIDVVDSTNSPVSDVEAYWFGDGKTKKFVGNSCAISGSAPIGVVLVRRDGFEFGGALLKGEDIDQIKIVLLRVGELAETRKTLPIPIDESDRRAALAAIVSEFRAELVEKKVDELTQSLYLNFLATVDSDWALLHISGQAAPERIANRVRTNAAVALASSEPEKALEIADDVVEPMSRVQIFFQLVQSLPKASTIRETCETELARTIDSMPQPQYRLAIWGMLAEYYQRDGRDELARQIVSRHLEDVEDLPSAGWAALPRSLFAALIVNDDNERAEQLVASESGVPERERDRALARLAFHAAQQHPARAIEYLGKISKSEGQVAWYAYQIRVAQWMAVNQPDSAIQLARAIDEPQQRAWTLGLIARRISKSDNALARSLLAEAEKCLLEASLQVDTLFVPATVMVGLLPIAEEVAPERIDPIIWQAVWLAIPHSRFTGTGAISRNMILQDAAAGISRYNRELALAMIGNREIEIPGNLERAVANQITLKPEGLVDLIKRINSSRFSGGLHPNDVLIKMLTGSQSEFWNLASLPSFLKWESDQFEQQ